MERRTVLKTIGLSLGGLSITPAVSSLLQSCQEGVTGWQPEFFTPEQATYFTRLIDLLIPSSAEVPGAKELNLIQFIDGYYKYVAEDYQLNFIGMALNIYETETLKKFNQNQLSRLSNEDIDSQLTAYLRAPLELLDSRSDAIDDLIDDIEEGNEFQIPSNDLMIEALLVSIRSLTILGFRTNEIIGKEHLVYAPVPGKQQGCVDLIETTGGKAWSL
jgi:hypothetical protein